MTVLVLLSPVPTLAGVLLGYWLGRRDPYRFVQAYAPIGTAPPTDLVDLPDRDQLPLG